jgi:hypothetical protein
MLLIADSGSTKTDWCLVKPNGERHVVSGKGINPHHIPSEQLDSTLQERIPPEINNNRISHLHFYGAGCGSELSRVSLANAFERKFSDARISIHPDYLGAARALHGRSRGSVAILGTGSSCCSYNGQDVTKGTSSLGYILGDEGSATDIGKRLLRSYYYGQLPLDLSVKLQGQGLSLEKTLRSLYQSSIPANYLAGFMNFMVENKQHSFVSGIIEQSFDEFFRLHVRQIHNKNEKLGVVGSVAYLFSDRFMHVAQQHGVNDVNMLQYPIEKLVEYHIGS